MKGEWTWPVAALLTKAQQRIVHETTRLVEYCSTEAGRMLRFTSIARSSAMSARLKMQVDKWVATGKPAVHRLPLDVAILRWWVSERRKTSIEIEQYLALQMGSCAARNLHWYTDVVGIRSDCSKCGEAWRMDSLVICTECRHTLGPCCVRDNWMFRWRDGTRVCGFCGRGALVG